MKNLVISLIFFSAFICNANAQLASLKNVLEKSPIGSPFYVLKKTAEKISSLGLKKLFFGITAGAMLHEAYYNPGDKKKYISDKLQDKGSDLKKIIWGRYIKFHYNNDDFYSTYIQNVFWNETSSKL